MSVLFANHGQVRVLGRGQGIIHKVETIVMDVMGPLSPCQSQPESKWTMHRTLTGNLLLLEFPIS